MLADGINVDTNEPVKWIYKGPPEPSGNWIINNLATGNSNPYALFALLELNKSFKDQSFLQLAEVIGDNILKRSFHKGFFLADSSRINANFDAIQPLALLSLEATLLGKPELVPVFSGGSGYIHGQFGDMGRTYDFWSIWSQKKQ